MGGIVAVVDAVTLPPLLDSAERGIWCDGGRAALLLLLRALLGDSRREANLQAVQ